MPVYQCSPLEFPEVELRLAILCPGKRYESVHCDLVTVNPEILQQYEVCYEALSYCWGKGDATKTIFIDGQCHQVKPNLEHALRHLRKRNAKRFLWVDALCINQQDNTEKNKQVPRMGWIYENAKEVVIWIGKDHENEDDGINWDHSLWRFTTRPAPGSALSTKLAFQFLENLAWFSRQSVANQAHFFHLVEFMAMCKNPHYCANLARLLRRQWFERLWTVQEIVLAKSAVVVCGYQSISWATLDAATKAMNNPQVSFMVVQDCPFFFMIGQERVSRIVECMHKREIFSLLDATQASKFPSLAIRATDARDKLFGMMGIMPAEDSQDIEVDYNLQTMHVYRSWVEKRARRTGKLDALSLCANTARRGFPSWVPDLNHRLPQDRTLFAVTHAVIPAPGEPPPSTRYSACGTEPFTDPEFSTMVIKGILRHTMTIRGLKVDTIKYMAPKMTGDIVPPSGDIQHVLEQLEQMIVFSEASLCRLVGMSRMSDYNEAKTNLYHEFGMTLFRGYNHPNIDYSLQAMYECYRGRNTIPNILATAWPPTRTQEFFANFGHFIRSFLWDARFFVTSGGEFGVASDNCNVEEKDEIWILKGGKTPFVMRHVEGEWRVARDNDAWGIMGPCYLCGAMNGEKITSGWTLTSPEIGNTDVTRWAKKLGTIADIKLI